VANLEKVDLRKAMNAISEIVANRPRPLREFDQIYMKSADMLLQAEHVSRWFKDRKVVCIGDGDAIGLCVVYLHHTKVLSSGPEHLTVLDFDERVVRSVRHFAEHHNLTSRLSAELYNVADPLPPHQWRAHDGFYTNPPYGKSNGGKSIHAFTRRGMEACKQEAVGCVVLADHPDYAWTQEVLLDTQRFSIDNGFLVAEMIPQFHTYHLDDAPDLTSCSLVIRRMAKCSPEYGSAPLSKDELEHFYGNQTPLKIRYIRDLTNGGKFVSSDHEAEPYDLNGRLFTDD